MKYIKQLVKASWRDNPVDWGDVTYFFEMDQDGQVLRQLEVHENGIVLKYDRTHFSDSEGSLSDKTLELGEVAPCGISESEFESAWHDHKAHNV